MGEDSAEAVFEGVVLFVIFWKLLSLEQLHHFWGRNQRIHCHLALERLRQFPGRKRRMLAVVVEVDFTSVVLF